MLDMDGESVRFQGCRGLQAQSTCTAKKHRLRDPRIIRRDLGLSKIIHVSSKVSRKDREGRARGFKDVGEALERTSTP